MIHRLNPNIRHIATITVTESQCDAAFLASVLVVFSVPI